MLPVLRVLTLLCFCLALWPLGVKADLRFLLPPVSSPEVMYTAFTPLAKALQKAIHEPVQLSFTADLGQFYLKAQEKRAQIVLYCPIAYLKVAHEVPYTPLAGLQPPPGGNHSVIVVRSDSPIQNLLQLRGKSFVMGNPACAASSLVPLALLDSVGIPIKSLGALHHGGSDSNALLDVAARFYDATAVAENVAEPYLRAGTLKILARTPVGPGDLIAASAEVHPHTLGKIKQTLLHLDQINPQAMAAIAPLASGMISIPPGTYDPLRSLYKETYGIELNPKKNRSLWRLGVPPAFSPLAAEDLFAPLRQALQTLTAQHSIAISVPASSQAYLSAIRAKRYRYVLVNPDLLRAAGKELHPIATLLPNAGETGLSIIRVDHPATHGALRVAYESPYCSARSLLQKTIFSLAHRQPVQWVPVRSERAVFAALGSGQANWGVVRSATVENLRKTAPNTWKIIAQRGPAPAWILASTSPLSGQDRLQLGKILSSIPKQSLEKAGFQEIVLAQ